MTPRIFWVPSPKFTAGHPAPLRAIVHHRMVGSLASTDTTFTTGSRIASTTFGVGYACKRTGHPSGAHVHQYVRLGDQAWGNGNWDASGLWDDRYPTANLNSRTISIEHHDNGGAPRGSGKGVVREDVIAASIDLDRMLLRGDLAELRLAGVRFRTGTESAITRELRAIVPGKHTIVDHHYIAGRLKPYCWRPWMDDRTGFPQDRYIAALTGAAPQEDIVESFPCPAVTDRLLTVAPGAWLYRHSDFRADAGNVQLDGERPEAERKERILPFVGKPSRVWAVAYDRDPTSPGATAYFVKDADVRGITEAPPQQPAPADCTAAIAAAIDADRASARIVYSGEEE